MSRRTEIWVDKEGFQAYLMVDDENVIKVDYDLFIELVSQLGWDYQETLMPMAKPLRSNDG